FHYWATAREVGCSVYSIVERAGEVKVVGDKRLDERAILVDVRLVGFFCDRDGNPICLQLRACCLQESVGKWTVQHIGSYAACRKSPSCASRARRNAGRAVHRPT